VRERHRQRDAHDRAMRNLDARYIVGSVHLVRTRISAVRGSS
jgi:hypothetical protein